MQKFDLNNLVRGWFVGNFSPAAYETNACEAACKHYRAGEREEPHYHKIATELTLVATGSVRMNDQVFSAGEVIVVEPGEIIDFEAIEDAMTMVIKIPSVVGDKYVVSKEEKE